MSRTSETPNQPEGPIDTSKTRLNAWKHGILSKETFIAVGDGQENAGEFEEFSSALQDSLRPVGAIEELVVDKIIAVAWRTRRIFIYETAAIRSISDTAIEDWEREQAEDPLRYVSGDGPWQSTADLVVNAKRLKLDLKALAEENPIDFRPELWESVFWVASNRFEVDIDELLDLDEAWEDLSGFTKGDIQLVIDFTCADAEISVREFWELLEKDIRHSSQEVARKLERRRRDLERVRLSVRLPTDEDLTKIQRYEAHLSREFYKALHEL